MATILLDDPNDPTTLEEIDEVFKLAVTLG
jgi:hypothetical protein